MPSEKTVASKRLKHRGRLVWPSKVMGTYRKDEVNKFLHDLESAKELASTPPDHEQHMAYVNGKEINLESV